MRDGTPASPWIAELARLTARFKAGEQLTARERRRLRKLTARMLQKTGRGHREWRREGHQRIRARSSTRQTVEAPLLPAPLPSLEYDLAVYRPVVVADVCPFTGLDLINGTMEQKTTFQRQADLGYGVLQSAWKARNEHYRKLSTEDFRLVGREIEKRLKLILDEMDRGVPIDVADIPADLKLTGTPEVPPEE